MAIQNNLIILIENSFPNKNYFFNAYNISLLGNVENAEQFCY